MNIQQGRQGYAHRKRDSTAIQPGMENLPENTDIKRVNVTKTAALPPRSKPAVKAVPQPVLIKNPVARPAVREPAVPEVPKKKPSAHKYQDDSGNVLAAVLESDTAQYQLESKLGEGVYGAVYRALDLTHNRKVALKVCFIVSMLISRRR